MRLVDSILTNGLMLSPCFTSSIPEHDSVRVCRLGLGDLECSRFMTALGLATPVVAPLLRWWVLPDSGGAPSNVYGLACRQCALSGGTSAMYLYQDGQRRQPRCIQ